MASRRTWVVADSLPNWWPKRGFKADVCRKRNTSPPRERHLRMESLEDRCLLAAFTVTTTADGGAGSLRQAIIAANQTAEHDTITLAAGEYKLKLVGAGENLSAT